MLREPAYPSGEHYVGRELVLNVQIELLHHALFEVQVLRLHRSREGVREAAVK